ncbi:MAG: amidase family protein, partial [Dehalococcoidia bacterium]
WVTHRLEEFDYDAQVKFLTGSLVPAQYYYKVQRLRGLLRQQVLDALGQFDVLVSPTMRITAPKIKPYAMPTRKEESMALLTRGPDQTPTVPLSNVPALSVPCGFASEEQGGMPIGLQIIGRPFEEATILNVAYAYEHSTTWHKRRPSI